MSKRVALIAAGAILTASGGILAAGGGALVAAIGSDDTLSTGRHSVTSATNALVTDQGDINDRGADVLGHPAIKISVNGSDKPVFVGVGPAEEVDRYLAGASVETVTDVEARPFELTTKVRHGSAQLDSPLAQSFWVAESNGVTSAATTWQIRDGDYRIVVMNADGSPGIDVEGKFGLHIPRVTDIGIGVLAGGLLLVAIGATLIIVGLRTKSPALPVEAASPYVAVRL
jgi:hypothetical protein